MVVSTRRPILFVSSPESRLFNPLFTIASELSRRQVPDLWFATDENRRAEIEGIGPGSPVRFVSLGDVEPRLSSSTWDDLVYEEVTQPSRWKAHRALVEHTFDPRLWADKYCWLHVEVDEIKPALMVVDSVIFFGVQVAITHGVPYALSVPFLPSNVFNTLLSTFPEPHSGLPRRMTPSQHLANVWFKIRKVGMFFTPKMWQVVRRIRATSTELGIAREARSLSARVKRAELIFSYSANGLDYPFSYPDKLHQLGAIVPPLPQAPDGNDMQRWLDTRYSVVYMAFGKITRLRARDVRALVDVARKLDGKHDVLWTLPEEQQKFLPPPHQLPGNLRVVSAPPSQLDVLAHPSVKLFFTYSGGSGFHEALYFGKPLVVRPLWIDCYDLAVRGRDSGVSLTLDRPEVFDVDDILDKLGRVLAEPSFRERARRFARAQQESGGTRRAAELILEATATT